MIPGVVMCREFVGFLDDYLANTLDAAQRLAFNLHLSKCPPCVAYLHSYQAASHLGRKALTAETDTGAVPDDVPEELIQAILRARSALPR